MALFPQSNSGRKSCYTGTNDENIQRLLFIRDIAVAISVDLLGFRGAYSHRGEPKDGSLSRIDA